MTDSLWLPLLLTEIASLRATSDEITNEEQLQCLLAILRSARGRSGLTRIGFDHKVKSLGINVVSLRFHGSTDALAKAIASGADSSAKGRHGHLPKEVRTACLIESKCGRWAIKVGESHRVVVA